VAAPFRRPGELGCLRRTGVTLGGPPHFALRKRRLASALCSLHGDRTLHRVRFVHSEAVCCYWSPVVAFENLSFQLQVFSSACLLLLRVGGERCYTILPRGDVKPFQTPLSRELCANGTGRQSATPRPLPGDRGHSLRMHGGEFFGVGSTAILSSTGFLSWSGQVSVHYTLCTVHNYRHHHHCLGCR
jgi:hypothetical protein